jgi:hypothetical protein
MELAKAKQRWIKTVMQEQRSETSASPFVFLLWSVGADTDLPIGEPDRYIDNVDRTEGEVGGVFGGTDQGGWAPLWQFWRAHLESGSTFASLRRHGEN